MNQKACLLACGLTLSALLFTGCTNNNDNVTTKNTGRGRMITHNVDNNGNYTTRSTGYRSYGVTTRDNSLNNAGRNVGEATRDLGRGLANTARNVGEDIGNAARDLTGMDNRNYNRYDNRYGTTNLREAGRDLGNAVRDLGRGTVNTTRNVGTNLGQATRDLTGIGSNVPRTGMGTTGTTRTYGLNGAMGARALGTDLASRGTNMHAAMNRDMLVLGNLVIYANKGNKTVTSGRANAGQMEMIVTDTKSIDAIHRVNRQLSANNAKSNAGTIATDIRYILKHAKPAR